VFVVKESGEVWRLQELHPRFHRLREVMQPFSMLRSEIVSWALDEIAEDTVEGLNLNSSCNRDCFSLDPSNLSDYFGQMLQVLLSFLESATAQAGLKRQSMLPIVACKLLFRAFAGEPDWPVEFVQVYSFNLVYTLNQNQRVHLCSSMSSVVVCSWLKFWIRWY
jgi:hypothetical protein